VVSRGGRPDLAKEALGRVAAPVLLIVGSEDPVVRRLNEQACEDIAAAVELVVIPGATHLFEQPGTLELAVDATVQRLDRWFSGS
jgi:pimeloyl-ACP methyl ester carboxylesterase